MSCVRCDRCSEIIDSDFDPECFTADSEGRYGDGPILCEPCREHHYCISCGERAADCDEDCHHCYAALFITGPEVYDPNETAPGGDRLWDRPGFREAEQLITAAMAARNAA